MVYEDFTTYTEVDEDGDITVTTTKCNVITMRRDALSYVRDDKGVDHFSDFEHLITVYSGTGGLESGMAFWCLTNGANTFQQMIDGSDGLRFYEYNWNVGGSPDPHIYLYDIANANSDVYDCAASTVYYCTIKRDGATLTAKIHSDAARTNLLDTLSVVCSTDAYRYVYAVQSRQFSTNPSYAISAYSQDFNFQEAGAPTAYSFIM